MRVGSLKWLALIAVAVVFAPPVAAQSGSWRVIGSASWLERTGETERRDEIPPVGTSRLETDFESGAGAGIAVAYFFNDNIALEARGSLIRPEMHVNIRTAQDTVAVIDLGEVNLFPLAAVLQYHIPTSKELRFFVGAGAGYLIVSDIETEGSVLGDRIEFEESLELIVNGGFNWHFDERWALNADARYVPIETDAETLFGSGQIEEFNIEPLIISAGLSYRF